MRRNVRAHQFSVNSRDYYATTPRNHLLHSNGATDTEDLLQLGRLPTRAAQRSENTMEAKVEPGDTLQAIALRFHCSVADIKRLNKIDKENEIHARKVIKIPVTVHNVLLETLPAVHKSGSNSPKDVKSNEGGGVVAGGGLRGVVHNPLEDAREMLSEKLMVASVNAAGPDTARSSSAVSNDINDIILSSKLKQNSSAYTDEDPPPHVNLSNDATSPLLADILDDSTNVPQLHRIRGPSLRTIDWSGSDCDMSWICLFVVILALCFVIPLIYVFYIAEHAHHNATAAPPHH